MPSRTDYVPGADGALATWALHLADTLTLAPASYGTPVTTAEAYMDSVTAYVGALSVATNPSTRTSGNISIKNQLRKALIQATRPLVQTLQNWEGMTDDKRINLGIPVRDRDVTPVPPPVEAPTLRVRSVAGRVVTLELLREDGGRGKPDGARSVFLYRYVGETMPASLMDYQFAGSSTSTRPQVVVPGEVAAGTRVWIFGCWANPRNQLGPASLSVYTTTNTVNAGQVAA